MKYINFPISTFTERDEGVLQPVAAIQKGAAVIGTVILSAIVILSGTFAALIPSGIMTLIQVAIAVIVGLLILFISLPLMLSAYIKLTYKEK